MSGDDDILPADRLLAELSRTQLEDPSGSSFPCAATTAYVQSVGKHFMAPEVVSRLVAIRARLAAPDTLAGRYLDCVLDRHDNRYRYDTYITLPLLLPLVTGGEPQLTPSSLAGLLIADAMCFELRALHGWHTVLPESRPPLTVVRKRLRLGARLAVRWACLPGPDRALGADRGRGDVLKLADQPDRPEAARQLIAALPRAADDEAALTVAVSVLPVDILHDEYLFIRILQSYEAVFLDLTNHLRKALRGFYARAADETRSAIIGATDSMTQAGHLFSTLATMSVDSFRRFRQLTEGASAIQSERYKELELLCGIPRAERLSSAAFDNVSEVQAAAYRNPDSLTRAYWLARDDNWFSPAEWLLIEGAIADLERTHQRWKTTHYRIAEKMLGDARGTGYTAGLPYLKEALENRLFWGVPSPADRAVGLSNE